LLDLGRGESAVFDEQARGLSASDQYQVRAGIFDPASLQRLDRGGEELQRVARWQLEPERD
jgi:hypothetical protein